MLELMITQAYNTQADLYKNILDTFKKGTAFVAVFEVLWPLRLNTLEIMHCSNHNSYESQLYTAFCIYIASY